ncbi:hypothetical protein V5799_023662 [Amblyomma americanum]|uniref:BACK domain-containing protein n=1 Tax=Amblyomma americanum TaxID=6943 RepID=A0AAQ4FHV8_AMBAM
MLLLDEPRDQCLSLLLRYMAPENCLGLATLTRRYSCPKFTDAVMAYVRQHFDHVWRCSENLRDIPEWLLYDLLCSPELNVSREEDALEVIARWYSATREEESSGLSDLLRCVRIGCCEPGAYHGLVQWRRRLFVVGGLKLQSYLRSVDSFDLDSCEWHRHSPMHVTRAYVAAAALGDHIYAIGGHTGVERTRTVERYEPLTNQWSMVASLSRRRSDGSACAYKGRLYVSGGFTGTDVLKTVEVYTPSLDCWTSVRSLPSPRCGHRMVEHCGRLYVIGGFDGLRRLEKERLCSRRVQIRPLTMLGFLRMTREWRNSLSLLAELKVAMLTLITHFAYVEITVDIAETTEDMRQMTEIMVFVFYMLSVVVKLLFSAAQFFKCQRVAKVQQKYGPLVPALLLGNAFAVFVWMCALYVAVLVAITVFKMILEAATDVLTLYTSYKIERRTRAAARSKALYHAVQQCLSDKDYTLVRVGPRKNFRV